MSFDFAQSFCFQLRASQYITGLNPFELKSYCHLNLLIASVFNYYRLDILWDSFGHPSKNLLPFEFAMSFRFQLRGSRYTTGNNRTYK